MQHDNLQWQRMSARTGQITYENIKNEVEDAQRKLRNYLLSSAYTNNWFSASNLSYKPEKTYDEKATAMVLRFNSLRQHFVSLMMELEAIKNVAQNKSNHYQTIINQIDQEDGR